ncbi:MAG: hypothetical protein OXH57_03505 [Ekhidna sp.]|nr:hypothetical protein [Ekhidna sp.]
MMQEYILTDEVIIDHLNSQLSIDRVYSLLENRDKWLWLNYIFVPIIFTIKFTLITLWILCAIILFGYKNTFKEIFRVVLIAEFVRLIHSFITLIWFGFIDTDYSLLDVQYFKPLSLLNFFEAVEVESWLIFPLQSLNLFEIAYMFVLAIGVKRILKKNYIDALNFTIPVYGTALVTWIVFITFLSINLTA